MATIDIADLIDADALNMDEGMDDSRKALMHSHDVTSEVLSAIAADERISAAVAEHLDSVAARVAAAEDAERHFARLHPEYPEALNVSGCVWFDHGPRTPIESLYTPFFLHHHADAVLALVDQGLVGNAVHDLPPADPQSMGLPETTSARLAALLHALGTGAVARSEIYRFVHPEALHPWSERIDHLADATAARNGFSLVLCDSPALIELIDFYATAVAGRLGHQG